MRKPDTRTENTDRELIRAAKGGNRAAFTSLVRRYEELVYKFSFKVCRDREKAEETLQDTFINVYRKLGTFDGKSKFSTWLYSIVTNNCLMKRRRRKLDTVMESLDDPPVHPNGRPPEHIAEWQSTPVEKLLNKELSGILDGAILKLPIEYRLVFVLRDVEGKSTAETAAILKISQEATKSRLRRARAFLREQLTPYMATEGT